MKTLGKNIIEFYNQILLISNNGGSRYYFDKINDIKFKMLANSIFNADLISFGICKTFWFQIG
ncbi:hypothetical protein [Borreliella lusitaniae]|uniref:Uncharacterized protein n=1 Tax=Borreliella lusitaniae TaxID=100177 RepID=A0ABZ0CHK2_9SPIR|nr:hypothetical protein [Borreliella lusitaniae]WNY68448.1 hypothetical protein QIA44_01105 [Borreliella lusitaniae]